MGAIFAIVVIRILDIALLVMAQEVRAGMTNQPVLLIPSDLVIDIISTTMEHRAIVLDWLGMCIPPISLNSKRHSTVVVKLVTVFDVS